MNRACWIWTYSYLYLTTRKSSVGGDDDAAVFGNFVAVAALRTFDIDENHRRSVHDFYHGRVIALFRNLLAALSAVADDGNCSSDLELMAVVVVHVTMCVDSLAAKWVDLLSLELQVEIHHDFFESLRSSSFVLP